MYGRMLAVHVVSASHGMPTDDVLGACTDASSVTRHNVVKYMENYVKDRDCSSSVLKLTLWAVTGAITGILFVAWCFVAIAKLVRCIDRCCNGTC